MFDPFYDERFGESKPEIPYTHARDYRMDQNRPRVSREGDEYRNSENAQKAHDDGLTCRQPL